MVYSPRFYLVSAAVATVVLQMQHASAGSLYYTTYTTSETANELSCNFPGAGAEVPDEYTTFEVNTDPTLPDVTTISAVPVTNPEYLTNTSTAPTKLVSTFVGSAIVSVEFSNNQDADTYVSLPSTTTPLSEPRPKDCATGWETATRKLEEDNRIVEHDRRLWSLSNRDLEKVEAHFGVKMETRLKKLPKKGSLKKSPWAAPYWPTYQDNCNVITTPGQPSATEKYARAFGKNVTEFMDLISAKHGIDSRVNAQRCSKPSDCANTDIPSVCAIRVGKSEGRCIPTWFGICHAWSGAATVEDEPNCPVIHNGVKIQPIDIKGLLSLIYDDTNVGTVFTGARFRTGSTETDEFGRSKDPALRDLNPGFFHIIVANLIGKLKTSFVVDVSAGREVWNQPVRGFKVFEQTDMSLKEAAKTFYGLEKYPWNDDAKRIVYIKLRLTWIIESYEDGGLVSSGRIDKYTKGNFYFYLLELDKDGKIIGGEWLYGSGLDHADFMWIVRTKPAPDAVTSSGISYAEVSKLLKRSVECSDTTSDSMGGDERQEHENQSLAPPSMNQIENQNNQGGDNLGDNSQGDNHQGDNNPGGNNQGGNNQGGGWPW